MWRFLTVFGVGFLCVLAVMIAVIGHWAIALIVFGAVALVAVLWGVIGGIRRTGVESPDRMDADLERAKTAQYMVRNKSQWPGGGM